MCVWRACGDVVKPCTVVLLPEAEPACTLWDAVLQSLATTCAVLLNKRPPASDASTGAGSQNSSSEMYDGILFGCCSVWSGIAMGRLRHTVWHKGAQHVTCMCLLFVKFCVGSGTQVPVSLCMCLWLDDSKTDMSVASVAGTVPRLLLLAPCQWHCHTSQEPSLVMLQVWRV